MISSFDSARFFDDAARVRELIAKKEHFAFVLTFGCQQNEADSEKLRGMAIEMGYLLTDAPEKADLILINTCAIREHAELKVLSVIGSYKHLREKNPDLIIGVCGCMAAEQHRAEQLKMRYPQVSFVLEPGELSELARSEYISSDMSQKKFRYKGLVYKLCGRVTYENDGLLFIYLTASLEGGGRERVTSADGHAWDKADECLLPPDQAIRRVRPDIKLRRKLRKSDGIVYLDGFFYSCTKGSLQEIKIKS